MTRLIHRALLLLPLLPVLMAAGAAPELPPPPIVLAAGSCAHAASVAESQGGQVIGSPRLVTQGGQQVCVVTVLIRKPDSPPVRRQITVPAR